jgi:hypothetical protein
MYAVGGCGNEEDVYEGHGTHVSNTAVGSIEGADIADGALRLSTPTARRSYLLHPTNPAAAALVSTPQTY